MELQLQRVLNAHQLPCGAVIVETGDVVIRVGDFAAFGSARLVPALLGPYGSALATFGSVKREDQARTWAQGDEFAFVVRAREMVVVVFGRDRGDAIAQYELSRLVVQSIATEFAKLDT